MPFCQGPRSVFAFMVVLCAAGCAHTKSDPYAARPGEFWAPPPAQPTAEQIQRQVRSTEHPVARAPDEKLDLATCVDIALKNNPGTRQSWQAARAAAANKTVVDSVFYPLANIGVSGQRSSSGSFDGSSNIVVDTYAPSLQINYVLFNFGGNWQNSRSARDAVYAANFNYNRTLQNVILQVAQNYYSLSSSEASIEAARFSVEDAKQIFESARLRSDAGLGTQQDLLRAEANLREAEFQFHAQMAAAEVARAALAQTLGVEVSPHIQIQGLVAPTDLAPLEKDVATLTAEALGTRPDLLAAYANAQSKDAALKATRSSLWPQLVFQFRGTLTTVETRPFNPTEDWTALLAVSWDIFDGFRKAGLVRLAKADAASARESVRQSYYGVVADVWTAYYSLESAKEQTTAARAQLAAATGELELTQAGYQNGLNTLLELVASQDDLESARLRKIQAETNFVLALARLANATGNIR